MFELRYNDLYALFIPDGHDIKKGLLWSVIGELWASGNTALGLERDFKHALDHKKFIWMKLEAYLNRLNPIIK